jgi:hypothetical protein
MNLRDLVTTCHHSVAYDRSAVPNSPPFASRHMRQTMTGWRTPISSDDSGDNAGDAAQPVLRTVSALWLCCPRAQDRIGVRLVDRPSLGVPGGGRHRGTNGIPRRDEDGTRRAQRRQDLDNQPAQVHQLRDRSACSSALRKCINGEIGRTNVVGTVASSAFIPSCSGHQRFQALFAISRWRSIQDPCQLHQLRPKSS